MTVAAMKEPVPTSAGIGVVTVMVHPDAAWSGAFRYVLVSHRPGVLLALGRDPLRDCAARLRAEGFPGNTPLRIRYADGKLPDISTVREALR